MPDSFRCYLVEKSGDQVQTSITERPWSDLPAGEVTIEVACSSLNYKDALATTAHPGVAKKLPHVPGIDAAGTVVASQAAAFEVGDEVLVTGYELGAPAWGGYAEYIRVPAGWVVPRPEGLSLRDAMIYGTAGFTAALCRAALEEHQVQPADGEIVVTGASGGVGGIAVSLLAQGGYQVVAVTGKKEFHAPLTSWGAARIADRDEVADSSDRPLLKAKWAGAVDTVGGNILATILKSTHVGGCVAACGMAAGIELPLTVYPFILRGVTLAGIDSAWCAREKRVAIWNKLAGDWKLDNLEDRVTEIDWTGLDARAQAMLAGEVTGRTLVVPPK